MKSGWEEGPQLMPALLMTMMMMTMMMMTMMRGDQVSGGRQGLAVIGRHALAKSDLKHDEANDQDDDDCR